MYKMWTLTEVRPEGFNRGQNVSTDLEPTLAEDWIKIQYWECNVLGHRHKTSRAAAACIVKRKGESGELKKLTRNLSMMRCLRKGNSITSISKQHHCSDPNVIKAVNSSLNKAWNISQKNNGAPYDNRTWKIPDFTNPTRENELCFLIGILEEVEIKLKELTK
ncbi:MAG: hypothetical protein C0610_16765 [Desulfobacteraceae bacterium]|nr:MAG: hypothetical protein C0610_16765 [Desulfobacteraceae bacterium]